MLYLSASILLIGLASAQYFDPCDCFDLKLIKQRNTDYGKSICYTYKVEPTGNYAKECESNVDYFVIGSGSCNDCGVKLADLSGLITSASGKGYEAGYDGVASYDGTGTSGIKVPAGYSYGMYDEFELCFDSSQVAGTQSGDGQIGFKQADGTGFQCLKANVLPDFCGAIEPCICYETVLLGDELSADETERCYKYQVNAVKGNEGVPICSADIDYIVLGRANSPNRCGLTDLSTVVNSISGDAVTSYDVNFGGDGANVEGIQISGVSDGSTFDICFDAEAVRGTNRGGNIGYKRGDDEYSCQARSTLFDLCPDWKREDAKEPVIGYGGDSVPVNPIQEIALPGNHKKSIFEQPTTMTVLIMSVGCSALVSVMLFSVFLCCMQCTKSKKETYGKVIEDEVESENDL